jgi:excisionase family DNA binding protein
LWLLTPLLAINLYHTMRITDLPEKVKLEISKEDLIIFANTLLEASAKTAVAYAPQSEILTMQEAVEFTHMAKPTLYAMTSKRQIPHFKRGKRVLFKRSELEAWMLEQKQQTVHEAYLESFLKSKKR